MSEDSDKWGKPIQRPLIGGTERGITAARFIDKDTGYPFTRYYGGNADGRMYGRRFDRNDPRIREEIVPPHVGPQAERPPHRPVGPHAPRGGRDTGLLGADSNALGGYQNNNRTYDSHRDITTVRFNDKGYVATYGNNGHVRLSLTTPPNADHNSHAWRYATNLARERTADILKHADRSVAPDSPLANMSWDNFVGPVKRTVVNGAHALGEFGQETASNWSDAVDNDRIAYDNWVRTHFIPEPVRKRIVGPPKPPSIGAPNHWQQFVNNPGGIIAGDTVKMVGGAVPSTVGLLNTRKISDLSGSMGPVPEALGTSLGAIMTMSTNPKVGAQGLRQAMTKLFMQDLPKEPVGTILSAIPFLDISKVARETGGATANKFYAARDSAIEEANARARAGDRVGATKLRNQAMVLDALGKAVGKPSGPKAAEPPLTRPQRPTPVTRSLARDSGLLQNGRSHGDVAKLSWSAPSSMLTPGWKPPDQLSPSDRMIADTVSPPGLSEYKPNSGASAKAGASSVSGGAEATTFTIGGVPVRPKPIDGGSPNGDVTLSFGGVPIRQEQLNSGTSVNSGPTTAVPTVSGQGTATVHPFWQAQSDANRQVGDIALNQGKHDEAQRHYQTAQKYLDNGYNAPGRPRYRQSYKIRSTVYDLAMDLALRHQGWKPVYGDDGSAEYYSPNTPDENIGNYDPSAEPPTVTDYTERPIFLSGTVPYHQAPVIPGYEWHHLIAPYGRNDPTYRTALSTAVRNDNSGGTVTAGVNGHTGNNGIHGTMDKQLVNEAQKINDRNLSNGIAGGQVGSRQDPLSDHQLMQLYKSLPADQQSMEQIRFWASLGMPVIQ